MAGSVESKIDLTRLSTCPLLPMRPVKNRTSPVNGTERDTIVAEDLEET